MKQTKGFSSLIIIIPMAVLTMAVMGVFVYKLYSEGTRTKAAEPSVVPKTLPTLQAPSGKPQTRYGGLTVPTPSPKTVSGNVSMETVDADVIVSSSMSSTVDFTSIDQAISGL